MPKEIPSNGYQEFYKAIGVTRERGIVIRNYLEERLKTTLDKFPFSSAVTSDIAVLVFEYQNKNIVLPGLDKGVAPSVLEKLMDNVLISHSRLEGRYRFGPTQRVYESTQGHSEKRSLYETLEFPIMLAGGRLYMVTKGIDCIHFANKKGKTEEEKLAVYYIASLPKEDLIVGFGTDGKLSVDFDSENF